MKSIHDLLSLRDAKPILWVNNPESDRALSVKPECFDMHKLAMITDALREGCYPLDICNMDLGLDLSLLG